jgi:hypothetical protein
LVADVKLYFLLLHDELVADVKLGVFDWWLSLQPPAHAGSSLADFSTLKMEAIRSSETSVHTRSARRHIPEDGILLHNHRREKPQISHWSMVIWHPSEGRISIPGSRSISTSSGNEYLIFMLLWYLTFFPKLRMLRTASNYNYVLLFVHNTTYWG